MNGTEADQLIKRLTRRVFGIILSAVVLGLAGDISGQSAIDTLEPGKSIEREIASGEIHSYQVILSSGQFAHIVIEQHGQDLAAAAFAPDGKQIATFDIYSSGPEPMSLVANASGVYRLEVQPVNKNSRGRYQIKLEELRSGKSEDEKLIAAERVMTEANKVNADESLVSLRRRLEKYGEVLLLCRAINDRRGEATALLEIGSMSAILGENSKALESLNLALTLFREIGDQEEQGVTLQYTARDYVSAAGAEIEFHLKFRAQRFNCFSFDQSEFAIGLRFVERALFEKISIAFETFAGNRPRLVD